MQRTSLADKISNYIEEFKLKKYYNNRRKQVNQDVNLLNNNVSIYKPHISRVNESDFHVNIMCALSNYINNLLAIGDIEDKAYIDIKNKKDLMVENYLTYFEYVDNSLKNDITKQQLVYEKKFGNKSLYDKLFIEDDGALALELDKEDNKVDCDKYNVTVEEMRYLYDYFNLFQTQRFFSSYIELIEAYNMIECYGKLDYNKMPMIEEKIFIIDCDNFDKLKNIICEVPEMLTINKDRSNIQEVRDYFYEVFGGIDSQGLDLPEDKDEQQLILDEIMEEKIAEVIPEYNQMIDYFKYYDYYDERCVDNKFLISSDDLYSLYSMIEKYVPYELPTLLDFIYASDITIHLLNESKQDALVACYMLGIPEEVVKNVYDFSDENGIRDSASYKDIKNLDSIEEYIQYGSQGKSEGEKNILSGENIKTANLSK